MLQSQQLVQADGRQNTNAQIVIHDNTKAARRITHGLSFLDLYLRPSSICILSFPGGYWSSDHRHYPCQFDRGRSYRNKTQGRTKKDAGTEGGMKNAKDRNMRRRQRGVWDRQGCAWRTVSKKVRVKSTPQIIGNRQVHRDCCGFRCRPVC